MNEISLPPRTAATGSGVGEPREDRPLRRDAERNRLRILDAAAELFARRGLGVTLNDIAHHAGVGVGTVYRRFPDKQKLVDGLFERRFEEFVKLMERALEDPDPWNGLAGFLARSAELQAADRGFKELITGTSEGLERISALRRRLMPMGEVLVARAHASGQLRRDISPQDLPLVQLITSAIIDASQDLAPDLYRRVGAIVLRGMSAAPDELPPLPVPPLEPELTDQVLAHFPQSPASRPKR